MLHFGIPPFIILHPIIYILNLIHQIMALWKISVKNSGIINGVRIEKGMSIEYVTKTTTPPLQSLSQHKDAINQLFKNKYGVDLGKAGIINIGRMSCEKIS